MQALVNGHDLRPVQPDPALAEQRLAMAEEHLASGRANRRDNRLGAARSAFYEAIWYALLALLAAWGLRLVADGEEGKHVILMKFGRNELRNTEAEREAGAALDAYRALRNQQMYRQPGGAGLGEMPKHAIAVVEAAKLRLSS